jgi:hypothetical protein
VLALGTFQAFTGAAAAATLLEGLHWLHHLHHEVASNFAIAEWTQPRICKG